MSETNKSNLFQFGILSVLLFMAMLGTWITWYQAKTQAAKIREELGPLKEAARELVIDDPAQFAVSKRISERMGEHHWRLYLPEGHRYSLNLRTSGLMQQAIMQNQMPEPESESELPPGRHEVIYRFSKEDEEIYLEILLNGKVVIEQRKPSDEGARSGTIGNVNIQKSQQSVVTKPLQLVAKQYVPFWGWKDLLTEQTNGVLLWIEKTE